MNVGHTGWCLNAACSSSKTLLNFIHGFFPALTTKHHERIEIAQKFCFQLLYWRLLLACSLLCCLINLSSITHTFGYFYCVVYLWTVSLKHVNAYTMVCIHVYNCLHYYFRFCRVETPLRQIVVCFLSNFKANVFILDLRKKDPIYI